MTIAHESTRSLVPAGAWRVDPARSSITWELNGEKVHNGRFAAFEASIEHSGADAFEIRGLLTIAETQQELELSARTDDTPRVRASGDVSLGDVTVSVLVDAVLERA